MVDVTGLNDQTWFDRAGDFHTDALHVVERYTLVQRRDTLMYEATIEDKNSSPAVEDQHADLPASGKERQLMEFKCVEFVEELMYGHYRKKPIGGCYESADWFAC